MSSIRTIWALALLDMKLWIKSPAAIWSALLPPFAMALLLAALTFTVLEQPVALVVESHGPFAARMEKLIKADEEAFILTATDAVTANRLLQDQEVAAIITIPADFDRKAETYEATLKLTLNNVDIDFSDDIRRSVERAAGEFDAPSLNLDNKPEVVTSAETNPVDGAGPEAKPKFEAEEEEDESNPGVYEYSVEPDANPYHIWVEEHDLRNTTVDFLHYQLIPVIVLLALNIGMTGTALHCANDRERRTARLLVLSPAAPWALVTGRLVGGVLATLAVLIPTIFVCIVTRTIVVPESHWLAFVALLLAVSICAAGLGAALGTLLHGARNIAMACSILATYLFLLGGGFTTIAFLPQWLRVISAFNPMRYAIDGLREALFYPNLTDFGLDMAVLTGTAIGSVVLGSAFVIRSWSR
jgi:ABC-type multidrug transport system permease subunit